MIIGRTGHCYRYARLIEGTRFERWASPSSTNNQFSVSQHWPWQEAPRAKGRGQTRVMTATPIPGPCR